MIGAKLASPDRPAVAYAGDGAWAMSMTEIMTAVRHDIPVTAVVFHNHLGRKIAGYRAATGDAAALVAMMA